MTCLQNCKLDITTSSRPRYYEPTAEDLASGEELGSGSGPGRRLSEDAATVNIELESDPAAPVSATSGARHKAAPPSDYPNQHAAREAAGH